MDAWDVLIVGVAAYLAVVSLVRMMAGRRNQLIDEVRQQLEQELTAHEHDGERDAA